VTSALPFLVFHPSSASFRVIRLIAFETQLTAAYMLDPWFLATIFVAPAFVLTTDPNQVGRGLGLEV
jgi:hypothetical protein